MCSDFRGILPYSLKSKVGPREEAALGWPVCWKPPLCVYFHSTALLACHWHGPACRGLFRQQPLRRDSRASAMDLAFLGEQEQPEPSSQAQNISDCRDGQAKHCPRGWECFEPILDVNNATHFHWLQLKIFIFMLYDISLVHLVCIEIFKHALVPTK